MPEDENVNLKMNYQVLEQVLARIRCIFRFSIFHIFILFVFQGPAVLWAGCARQNDS